jgi:hypothetical protein
LEDVLQQLVEILTGATIEVIGDFRKLREVVADWERIMFKRLSTNPSGEFSSLNILFNSKINVPEFSSTTNE